MLNAKWHLANKMPKKPTLDQRIKWHLTHADKCGCRPIPKNLLLEINQKPINPYFLGSQFLKFCIILLSCRKLKNTGGY